MPKRNVLPILLLLSGAISACATQPPPAKVPVAVTGPQLPPAPADVMAERPANFRQRLLDFFSN